MLVIRQPSAHGGFKGDRRQAERPIGEADCQIAAISRSHVASLVTRNIRDFEGTGVEVIDPWATG